MESKMSREGKIHLVESCSFPSRMYKNVTNDEHYQSLKEAAQNLHAGKSKLTEATTINKMKKVLAENQINEEVQERVLKGLQEAGANPDDVEIWQFPVSKINTTEEPNLNGRVYNKQLWQNVIDKQVDVWKGGTGLANHPRDDEDGDFMKQSIVWLDGFLGDDGLIYGIGTFVGEGGALARQIISVGGRVGFSTSGYGDFLSDGITVDPDGYEIDRFADLVLNPSQGVYGDHGDIMKKNTNSVVESNDKLTESVKKIKESEEKETQAAKDTSTEDEANDTENEDEDDEDITLSEELVLNHYIESIKNIVKEPNQLWEEKVQKLGDLVKKLKKESLAKSSKIRLNKQIEESTEAIMKDARKAIQEGYTARKICEDLGISDISKLTNFKEQVEDFASLEECLNQASKEAKKYKELYEAKEAYAMSEANSSFEAETRVENLTRENTSLKRSLTESKTNSKDLKKQLTEAKAELDEVNSVKESLVSNKKHLIAKLRKFTERNVKLEGLLEEAEKTIHALEARNRKADSIIRDLQEQVSSVGAKARAEHDRVITMNRTTKDLREKLNKEATTRKQYEAQTAKEKRIAETNAKIKAVLEARKAKAKEAEMLDEDAMFRDSDNITQFLNENGVVGRKGYKNLSTVEEAENKLLFTNELLEEDAELERENLRTPKDVPSSLAEMFK